MSDDWCYVDSETGSVRSSSFDVDEPELELEPIDVKRPVVLTKAKAVSSSDDGQEQDQEQDVDVAALLSDSARPTCYSRSLRLSLLSPAHHRYVVTGTTTLPTLVARKRSVREAFTAPSRPKHADSSYAARLRAEMPSRHREQVLQVEATAIKPFTRDQGVQTDDQELVEPDHLSSLASALDRSLRLSMALKAKAHDADRLDVRAMHVQRQLGDLHEENEKLKKQLRTAERGLRISRKRGELAEEFQDHLKRGLEELRADTELLHQRIEVLAGGLDVEAKSITELEQLEDSLDKAMKKIRGALRAKYHAVIQGNAVPGARSTASRKASEDACVVCMEKLACVRLEPCGHEVLCSACAVRVSECPIDRQQIHQQVLTHGVNAYRSD